MLDVLERSSHGGGGRSHQRKGESRLAHLGRMKIQGGNLKKVKEYPDDEGATKQLERGKQLLHKSKASARPTGNKLTKYLATGIEFGSSQLPLSFRPISSPLLEELICTCRRGYHRRIIPARDGRALRGNAPCSSRMAASSLRSKCMRHPKAQHQRANRHSAFTYPVVSHTN
jgi:hypothetical protein